MANTVFFNAVDVIDLACNWYKCDPKDLERMFDQDRNGTSFMNDVLIGI